ncbi:MULTISPECIES: winged helix-turn-helix transcriptional regulator [Rhizobium]|uniref:winged helix-turn-helix transcriptional regulator n=1 Tax=Rhizobium TaxID=379 RepID=UPI00038066CD|nr:MULTISPECIES: helix-turn-helix domain-containing protein [Rhizobium]MBY3211755.1 helix-turn-helix transcriptional regulator [Rhizobium laguerreae]MBY5558453.1 helix-turn-helix transcriptional regulator [Rhizobium leguminosarum]MBY5725237.1 helix-turn-helix transcriptional regulator [Rhizobium leguminosarum]QSW27118.1 helix-turn-helix transcriptional regulator [Rhizobium leguminosarum]
MKRTGPADTGCPILRSLKYVGEPWTILIIRDALAGTTRFDEFLKNLNVAPNILTARLKALVEGELMERRRYSERPPRDEYHLTDRGSDFRPVIQAMLAWGNRHLAPEGPSVLIVNTETGEPADPVMVDGKTGRPLSDPIFAHASGPAASDRIRRRYPSIADFQQKDNQSQ